MACPGTQFMYIPVCICVCIYICICKKILPNLPWPSGITLKSDHFPTFVDCNLLTSELFPVRFEPHCPILITVAQRKPQETLGLAHPGESGAYDREGKLSLKF